MPRRPGAAALPASRPSDLGYSANIAGMIVPDQEKQMRVIEERDVRVEHFARVSEAEMNSAQKFLDRAAATRAKLISLLEGSDGD